MNDGFHPLLDELVERIAERAAEIVLERLDTEREDRSPWLTVREVAAYTKLPVARVYKLTAAASIPCHRVGSRILVHKAELDTYLEQR